MNNNYEKNITNNLIRSFFKHVIIYTIIYVFTLVIAKIICGNKIWYYSDPLYNLYDFLRDTGMFVPFLIIVWLIGVFIILYYTLRKSLKLINSIVNASELLIRNDNSSIKLPEELTNVQEKMNQVKMESIKNYEKAVEAEKKKNELIMYMAHDLKTPLTSVIGYLTLLTDEKEISKKLQEKYLKIALDKSLRVEELTNQFFEITRYDLKEIPINKQNIDITMLIEQLIQECYPMLEKRKLKCIFNKTVSISYIGDGDKLARAFENLLKNAINYSYENTDIIIDIYKYEDRIKISFKNRGDKIPEYKLEKLFDKFYRVDESRQSDTGGTGLGLAIAKDIIELHKGNINVKNDTEYIEFNVILYT